MLDPSFSRRTDEILDPDWELPTADARCMKDSIRDRGGGAYRTDHPDTFDPAIVKNVVGLFNQMYIEIRHVRMGWHEVISQVSIRHHAARPVESGFFMQGHPDAEDEPAQILTSRVCALRMRPAA